MTSSGGITFRVSRCLRAIDRLVGIISVDRVKQLPRDRWATTTVREIMLPIMEVLMAGPGDSLWSAFQKLSQNGLGRLAVLDHGRLAGF
jgi:CBS domain-containing protein